MSTFKVVFFLFVWDKKKNKSDKMAEWNIKKT